jgi:transketolase
LSATELLAILYFRILKVDPHRPNEGHSSQALYAVFGLRGYLDPAEGSTFGQVDSRLQGHRDMTKLPVLDMFTESRGLGLPERSALRSAPSWAH